MEINSFFFILNLLTLEILSVPYSPYEVFTRSVLNMETILTEHYKTLQ